MFRKVFWFFLVSFWSNQSMAQSLFGRYVGVLKHSQINQDQLAKLDFIVASQTSSEFRLIAVLSLYFGDFASPEYVTYHFDNVKYNVLTGTLVFDQPEQDVTLIVSTFGNGNFEGNVRSTVAGDVGVLQMQQGQTITPMRPLVQPLWGEYRGVCDGVTTVLQIQTSRSSGDSSRMGNPFGTFDTTAQIAEVMPSCFSGSSLCVKQKYDVGSYNFFSGKLDLAGRAQNLACDVTSEGIECQKCSLRRSSSESATLDKKSYPVLGKGYGDTPEPEGNDQAVTDATGTSLSGNYYGYVFHERLGVYQPVSMNVVTYQGIGGGGSPALYISATSSMYFGNFQSPEVINHRFNEKEFPLLSPQIVLERIEGDVDTIIQLSQFGDGKAKGIWYSILHGRVGTFELSNGVQPAPPEDAKIMGKIGGQYQGNDWSLDLRVVRESTPINTVNPYYPLNFAGAFRLDEITPNIRIKGGAFDFYTGKLVFHLEDDTLFTGFRPDNNTFSLKRPTPRVIVPMTPHRPVSFKRVSE
jgi:hypothetical protein